MPAESTHPRATDSAHLTMLLQMPGNRPPVSKCGLALWGQCRDRLIRPSGPGMSGPYTAPL